MISINATLIVQVIHFLILMFILNRIMLKPIMNIIERRSRKIEEDKKQREDLKSETEELVQKCISIEKEARKKAVAESSLLRSEASEKAEDIVNKARDEISGIREKADHEIDSKIEEASSSLKKFASEIAEELTEKVIGRRFVS